MQHGITGTNSQEDLVCGGLNTGYRLCDRQRKSTSLVMLVLGLKLYAAKKEEETWKNQIAIVKFTDV